MALYSLNDQMEFDHVIRITEDGTVTFAGEEVCPVFAHRKVK